ncbi:MAG: hypothetical protein D6814_16675 [Calditrichaeota bacterium]|nr:MAG: hypothetical protein D6814_16675 [Calditrichota bacterium]
MKSLSSNITSGMNGGSRPVYLLVIKPRSGDSWNRFAWATEDITLNVATGSTGSGTGTTAFTDTNATFISDGVLAGDAIDGDNGTFAFQGTVQSVDSETQLTVSVTVPAGSNYAWTVQRTFDGGRIRRGGLGKIRQEVNADEGGGVATISDFEFDVLNQDDFFSSLPSYLENREVEVRLIFADQSGATWINALILGKFLIEDIEPDLDKVHFTCADALITRHREIPSTIISLENFPNAPSNNIGKPVPLLFGDFTAIDTNTQQGSNLATALMVDRFKAYFIAADHVPFNAGSIYAYDENLKEFLRIASFNTYTSLTGLPSNKTYFEITDAQVSRISRAIGKASSNGVTNWENICDQDLITKESIGKNLPSTASFKIVPLQARDGDSILFKAKLLWQSGHSGNGDYVEFLILSGTTTVWTSPSIQSDQNIGSWDVSTVYKSSAQTDIELRATFTADPLLGAENIADIYEMWVYQFGALDKLPLILYTSADGRAFGSWIDADSRNNGYNQNDLIENPAYIIESILRDVLGLTSSEINYQSFDAAGNTTSGTRNGWKFAFQLLERKNSIDLIDELCKNSQLIYYVDYQLRESLRELPLSGATSQKSLSLSDYTLEGKKSSFHVKKSPLEKIYNDFEVRYHYNYATQEYEKRVFCNKDGRSSGVLQARQDDCSNSYNNYGFERKLVVESPYIRDDTTAIYLLSRLVIWFTGRKKKVSFKTMLNGLDIELGDVVTPYHPFLFPSGDAVVTMIEYDLNRDLITFEAREL